MEQTKLSWEDVCEHGLNLIDVDIVDPMDHVNHQKRFIETFAANESDSFDLKELVARVVAQKVEEENDAL